MWDIDLFESRIAREYGWTLKQIDQLTIDDRQRLSRWWAVESLTRDAEQYLARFAQTQAQTMQAVARMRGQTD
ncbi:MAG: hypothetical protein NAOJABEB_02979 [Steroidobacteraceae bacterium]|nr:hypothetical protein [Steroidobacteraceae bacterium]